MHLNARISPRINNCTSPRANTRVSSTSEQAPIKEPTPEQAPELEPEQDIIAATIERPITLSPQLRPKSYPVRPYEDPKRVIPFNPNGAGKRPRGHPPKSKSSTNDDQKSEPCEHINTALAASQLDPIDTIDLALLSNIGVPSSTAPKALRSRGSSLAHPYAQ